jgi:hypothetical protein
MQNLEPPADGPAPLVLYVPGLLPKPPANLHRDALKRCLVAGVRRVDAHSAEQIRLSDDGFDIVAWTYEFYAAHRDLAMDRAAIDQVIERPSASVADMREASSWRRRLTLWLYRTGDLLPFLIPHLASERVELHLRDLHRYVRDEEDVASRVRDQLKLALRAAHESGRPILLLAHSMGSVIAFDALWEMTHIDGVTWRVDLWMTLGSPLGQRYLKRRLLGHGRRGAERYPGTVRRWVNIAAVGDMTAIDPVLADDYGEMLTLGLVESITDLALYSHFRLEGTLNVHAEYGYLANAVTGKIVADWWSACAAGRDNPAP